MSAFPFERWPQFDQVFETALDLEGDRLRAYLDESCDDPEMRREIEALLASESKSRRLFGDGEVLPWAIDVVGEGTLPDAMSGRAVGAYRLLGVIGQGGTSTVYRAERADGSFRQHVAVKILDPALLGRDAKARFRQEQQILAGLTHPNIARLFDGGITTEGWPYIVMELVEGEPIDRYCEVRRLSVRERLRLFLPVCRAVQEAHGNLIVHRDLKPGNILVTAEGVVKLLDFGIAKLLGAAEVGGDVVETRPGIQPMTPAYAAPEQIKGGAVTTATDVYQLGEVLHLLLTGRRASEDEAGWAGMLARVERDAPRKPSTWKRELAGDLDTLVLTAMRTDPGRRYHSAEEMARDIERYLDRRPLAAHPDSLGYRTAKLLRRQPIASAVTLVACVAVFALSVRLVAEYRRAESETGKASAVTDFLVGLFQRTNPGDAATDTLTAMALLDEGAERIEQQLADQPVVQAAVMSAVGKAYFGLGRYQEAEALIASALDRRRTLLPPDHPDLLASLFDMGEISWVRSRLDEAEGLYRQAIATSRRLYGSESRESARALAQLALVLHQKGKAEEALVQYQDALRIYRRTGPLDKDATDLLVNLGWLQQRREHWPEAEAVTREAIEVRRQLLGDDHASVASALAALAGIELRTGRADSAIAHASQALQIMQVVYGAGNVKVADPLITRANALLVADRADEAEADYRRALHLVNRQFGEASPNTARINNDLGSILRNAGRLGESEDLLRAAVRGYGASLGEDHLFTGIALHNLAMTVAAEGQRSEARQLLRRAIGIFEGQGLETSPTLGRSLTLLGGIEVETGHLPAADSLLRRALSIWESADPQDPVQLANTRAQLGRSLYLRRRFDEAEPLLLDAHGAMRKIGSDAHPATRRVAGWLADLYDAVGRSEKAKQYRELAGS